MPLFGFSFCALDKNIPKLENLVLFVDLSTNHCSTPQAHLKPVKMLKVIKLKWLWHVFAADCVIEKFKSIVAACVRL